MNEYVGLPLPDFAPWPGRFTGRVLVVTGAAGGLGSASVDRLRAEGATVVATDVCAPTVPAGDIGLSLSLDVTDPGAWKRVVDLVIEAYGRLDGALFCHGVQGPESPVGEVPIAGWERTLDINLAGCFHGLQAMVPVMREARYGRIAMLASIAGRDGNENMAAYSVSKAGLIALGKSAAKENARFGISINSVAPSMFQTPLLDDLSAERNAALLSKVPMGRIGQPAEFAALAAWLLSAEASYMTGQTLDLSGGRNSA
ncbi:SDR family NAD(P)-dependent oxidoreductase [Paeniglutamicibacter gangotriensis]|uniref:SDR family NAD(P)-dependent oxidoreductase n=1 Tax=Paeniglutamicibacter gangotriensis TaxID=254787 RepID=UPI0037C5D975